MDIIQSGEIGEVQHIDAYLCIPFIIFNKKDIRFNFELGGGSLMDLGCYVINFIRFVMGGEPEGVTSAEATLAKPKVDSRVKATLQFSENRTANLEVNLRAWTLANYATISGTKGKVVISGLPAFGILHSIKVTTSKGTRTEKHYGSGESTYYYQLVDFVKLVRGQDPACKTMGEDGILNMRVIDAIYKKTGLPPRGE